jgi:hypothetical protein
VEDYTIHTVANQITKGASSCFHPAVGNHTMATGTAEDFFGCVHYSNGVAVPVDHLMMDVNGDDRAIWWTDNPGIAAINTSTDWPHGGNGAGFLFAAAQGSTTLHSSFPGAAGTIYKDVAITVQNSDFSAIYMTGDNFPMVQGAAGCDSAKVENRLAETDLETTNAPDLTAVTWDACEIPGTQMLYHIWGVRSYDGVHQHLNSQLYSPDDPDNPFSGDMGNILCHPTSGAVFDGDGPGNHDPDIGCFGMSRPDGVITELGGYQPIPAFISGYWLSAVAAQGPPQYGAPEEVFIISPIDTTFTTPNNSNWAVELLVELDIDDTTYYNHDYDKIINGQDTIVTADWAEQFAVLQDYLALDVPATGDFRTLNFNPFPDSNLPVNVPPFGVFDNAFLYTTVDVPILGGSIAVSTGSRTHYHGTINFSDLWIDIEEMRQDLECGPLPCGIKGHIWMVSWTDIENTGANPVAMHKYPLYGAGDANPYSWPFFYGIWGFSYPMYYYGMVQRAQGVTETQAAPIWGFFHGTNALLEGITSGVPFPIGFYSSADAVFVGETMMTINP